MVIQQRFDMVDIVGIDKAVGIGTEIVVHLLLSRRLECGDGTSVKRVLEGDHFVALGLTVHFSIFACDLDRPFVRFGTAVGKKAAHVISRLLHK
ncbi:hypothetical protein D3C81_1841950 [compost metagenome]